MSMKLNVGVSRKVGVPDFGSIGASCSLELELDVGLLDRDRDEFAARVRDVYAVADRAVHDELTRLRSEIGVGPSRPLAPPRILAIAAGGRLANGPSERPRPAKPATPNQVKAIAAIARRNRVDLGAILERDFGVSRPEELSLPQASSLIDTLKSWKEE